MGFMSLFSGPWLLWETPISRTVVAVPLRGGQSKQARKIALFCIESFGSVSFFHAGFFFVGFAWREFFYLEIF